MRAYATRRFSPSFGVSPVRRNAGSTGDDCCCVGARTVLFPDVVFSWYEPAGFVPTFHSEASALFAFFRVIWAKNAALRQNSWRVRFARLGLTCSRCPSPLWQDKQLIV